MTDSKNCLSLLHLENKVIVVCQLPKGHGGKHTYGITWNDDEELRT